MADGAHRGHLAQALRWSPHTPRSGWQAAAACVGMAAPVALGLATGHAGEGFAAAVGAIMIGGVPTERRVIEQARDLGVALAPALAAIFATLAVHATGPSGHMLVVPIAAIAALAGSFSRPLAIAAWRFVLFLLICVSIAGSLSHPGALLAPVAAGLAWTALANLFFGAIARAVHPPAANQQEAPRRHSLRAHWTRWKGTLRHLAGWQYTIRLTACLAIAAAIVARWPERRLHWVGITVALLIEREVEALPVRTTQRAAGTFLGVIVAALAFEWSFPGWAVVAIVAVLAAARSLLRTRNYLAYTVVTTPLIVAILDAGAPAGFDLLAERLGATLLAALLVVAANGLMRRWLD
ncbi:MAG TPA: FUSC family protein [Usitatibacter sp.]|jgi:hypothetical protein|nr:FUSC family protein [Usitatibacter sp.]